MYNVYGNLNYKGFDFVVNFNGLGGNKIYDNTATSNFYKAKIAKNNNTTAEAKLRKGTGNEAAALADVNAIRASRTARIVPPALTEMNLDLLYRERGFELYWEFVRRTDMIRFGKYESVWTEKTNADPKKRIFPFPQNAIDGASNLPDYLVQNPGY